MKRAGYRWELRRNGELKIGFWRKSLRSEKSERSARTTASSRKLVLVPGFGDTSMSWLAVLAVLKPALRKNYDEIILVDFPGFAGFLSHEKAFHSMDLLQGALFDALDSIAPKTLMGHSLGGWLAALYAAECGEGARPKTKPQGTEVDYAGPDHLILADPSGVFVDEATSAELKEKFKRAIAEDGPGFDAIREHVFAREPFWIRACAHYFSGFFRSEEIARFVDSFDEKHLLSEERLRKIAAKVWLIWGERDTLVPPTSIPLFLKALNVEKTHCKAILLTQSGHSPQIETPGTLALVLSQVLSEASGGKARYYSFPASERFWKLVEEA
jgi:pimeloyl-ACP methyl ester carboxylesterase